MAKSNVKKSKTPTAGGAKRGRTNIPAIRPDAPTVGKPPTGVRQTTTRAVSAGGSVPRGDRRDTSKTYSGTRSHASRGSDPRPDVKTRKR